MIKSYHATVTGNWPIYFGPESRELLVEEIEKLAPDRVYIVMDRTVEALHSESILENIPHKIEAVPIVFNEGEENKNLATLEHVAGDLLREGANERSLILNVGGGVTLDLGGMAASLLGKGFRFAQVPTTLHAQWASVNTRRQAVNFIGRRNALGVYRAPEFTLIDPQFVESEETRSKVSGLTDFVGDALVMGEKQFDFARQALEKFNPDSDAGNEAVLGAALEHSLETGRNDPEEKGIEIRARYGSEIARALQAMVEGRLLPGESRWHAMRISGELARIQGLLEESEHQRHNELLSRLKIQTPIPAHIRADHFVFKLHGNNKTERDNLRLPLLKRIGEFAEESPVMGATVTDRNIAAAFEKVKGSA